MSKTPDQLLRLIEHLLLLLAVGVGLAVGQAYGRAGCVDGGVKECHCCPDPAAATCCDVPQGPLQPEPATTTGSVDAKQVPAPTRIFLGLQPQFATEPPRIHRPLAVRMPAILDRICVRLI